MFDAGPWVDCRIFDPGPLAVAATWYAFRHHRSGAARTAVLLAGTFFVSPYMLNYDLLLLMPAVIALYRRGATEGFHPLEPLVYAGMWVIPTLTLYFSRPLHRSDYAIAKLLTMCTSVFPYRAGKRRASFAPGSRSLRCVLTSIWAWS